MKLSDRQHAALLALADFGNPVSGGTLANQMTRNGRETSLAAAHQAANGLRNKGLAIKGYPEGSSLIRYEVTGEGRKLAAQIRNPEAATAAGQENGNGR